MGGIADLLKKPEEEQTVRPENEIRMAAAEAATNSPGRGPLKTLRTFQGDMAEFLQKNSGSVATVAIAEEKRKERIEVEKTPENTETAITPKRGMFVYVGSILIILGVVGLGISLMMRMNNTPTIVSRQTIIPYFSEKTEVKNSWNRSLLLDFINQKKADEYPVGSIVLLSPLVGTSSPLDTIDFLNIVGPRMPSALSRSFDGYMLGIYTDGKISPFIILSVGDFGSSYAGMLRWEKDMPDDLNGIFQPVQQIGTSTQKLFEDLSLKNVDLRVIKDKTGKIMMLYSFLDKKTLLLAESENVFNAVLSKYINNNYTR